MFFVKLFSTRLIWPFLLPALSLSLLAGQAGFAEHAAEAKQRSPHFFFCRLHEI